MQLLPQQQHRATSIVWTLLKSSAIANQESGQRGRLLSGGGTLTPVPNGPIPSELSQYLSSANLL